MCLSHFVAFRVTFNDLCCGLLSRIHLRITDQYWQTGSNEFALHLEVVFVFSWHQIGKVVQVVLYTVSLFCSNYTKLRLKFIYWRHWNKSSIWGVHLACIYIIFWKKCWQKCVWVLHLCVCLALLHFVSLLTIYGVERNIVARCHAYI